jgi:hypothetical protein
MSAIQMGPEDAQPHTFWIRVYSRNINNSNRVQELHSHTLSGQEFIIGISAIQIEPRQCIVTHFLEVHPRHISYLNRA